MSRSRGRRGIGPLRLTAVGALMVVNAALVVGILQKNSLFPFDGAGVATEVAGDDDADFSLADPAADGGLDGDETTGETLSTTAPSPDPLNTDTEGTPGVTVEDVDDWPGGRGPVPDGPPLVRQALFDDTGLLVLTGSVPSWALATQIVEAAGARLPDGVGAVDNQLTWHPDAPDLLQAGSVRLDPAVLYPTGSTAVAEDGAAGLDLVAEILIDNPTVFIVIIGHTDDLGDSEENAAVAFARATGVIDYLEAAGANPAQMVIAASGGGDPVAANDTEEGRTLNRRIEIQFQNFLTAEPSLGS